jgi:hypothetical protein
VQPLLCGAGCWYTRLSDHVLALSLHAACSYTAASHNCYTQLLHAPVAACHTHLEIPLVVVVQALFIPTLLILFCAPEQLCGRHQAASKQPQAATLVADVKLTAPHTSSSQVVVQAGSCSLSDPVPLHGLLAVTVPAACGLLQKLMWDSYHNCVQTNCALQCVAV